MDNKFGSSSPIPYDDPIYHDIRIKYHGQYTFKITNPLVFFQNVVGNVTSVFTKEQLMEQADAEFLQSIAGALGRCAADGIKYSALTVEQERIANYMNDALDEKWRNLRGMEVVSVALDTPVPDYKSAERIEKFADSRFYSVQENAAGRMVTATANAMENAASNENGAATGFMGLGMMNMAAGNMMGGQSPLAYTTPAAATTPATPAPAAATETAPANEKHCTNCGSVVTGKFCANCGTKVEEEVPEVKKCPNCGAEAQDGAKFCGECGTALN